MNRKRIMTILFAILMCFPLIVNASYTAEVTGTNVNFRKGPGTGYASWGTVGVGTVLTMEDKTLYTGDGCSNGWYKATWGSNEGYICSKYVTFVTAANSINTQAFTARISGNDIACRTGPSTSKSMQDKLSLGVNVKILETVTSKNSGCSGDKWYKVSYYDNKIGYRDCGGGYFYAFFYPVWDIKADDAIGGYNKLSFKCDFVRLYFESKHRFARIFCCDIHIWCVDKYT